MIEITHRQARFLIRRATDKRLPEEQWTALQAHLERCAECRAYAERQRWLERDLRRALRDRWRALEWQPPALGRAVAAYRAARGERARMALYGIFGLFAAALVVLISVSRWSMGGPSTGQIAASMAAGELASAAETARVETASAEAAAATAAAPPPFTGVIAFESLPAVPVEGMFTVKRDIFLLTSTPNGIEQTNLTQDPHDDFAPAWSTDGQWLAFLSDRSGSVELYVVSVAGTRLTRLTDSENIAWEGPLDWSNDGRYISLTGSRLDQNGDRWVYLVPLDGSGPVSLPGTRGTPGGARFARQSPLVAAPTAGGGLLAYSYSAAWQGEILDMDEFPVGARLAGFDWSFLNSMIYQISGPSGSTVAIRGPFGPLPGLSPGSWNNHVLRSSGRMHEHIALDPDEAVVATLPRDGECRNVHLLLSYVYDEAQAMDLPGLCVIGGLDRASWLPDLTFPREGSMLVAAARPADDPGAAPGVYLLRVPNLLSPIRDFHFFRLADLTGAEEGDFYPPQVRPTGGSLNIQPQAAAPPGDIPTMTDAELGESVRAALDGISGYVTLLMARPGAGGTTALLRADAAGAGSPPDMLLPANAANRCPAPSPDGTKIAFLSDFAYRQEPGMRSSGAPQPGPEEVFVLDLATREVNQITDYAVTGRAGTIISQSFSCPVWSPDGRYISVVSTIGQGSAVLVLSPRGQVMRRVPSDPASRYSTPQWSPDGNTIYLAQPAVRGLAPRIVAVPWRDPVTGRTLLILDGWEDVHGLSLSPDGSSLAFIEVPSTGETAQRPARLRIVSLPGLETIYQKQLPGYNAETAPAPAKITWMQEGQVVLAIPYGSVERYKARIVRYIPSEDTSHDLAYTEDALTGWSLVGHWLVYATESGLWGGLVNGRLDGRSTPIRLSPAVYSEVLLIRQQ